jgi:hypothetical protein
LSRTNATFTCSTGDGAALAPGVVTLDAEVDGPGDAGAAVVQVTVSMAMATSERTKAFTEAPVRRTAGGQSMRGRTPADAHLLPRGVRRKTRRRRDAT